MNHPDLAARIRARLLEPRPYGDLDLARVGEAVYSALSPDAPREPLSPSKLGRCARALAYGLAGEPRTSDSRDTLSVQATLGHAAEFLVVAALADALPEGWRLEGGRHLGQQARSVGALDVAGLRVPLEGSTDGILHHESGRAVLEVKGVGSGAMTQIGIALAKGVDPWGPGHRHYWQNEAYLLGTGCDDSFVVAVCRDTGRIEGWWRKRDPGHLDALRAHLGRVFASYDPDEVPRCDPAGGPIGPIVALDQRKGVRFGKPLKAHGELPRTCGYCDFARRCWGEELSETWKSGRRTLRLKGTKDEGGRE